MAGRYPSSLKPNQILQAVNAFVADLGAPALAVANRYVASVAQANGAYTIANASPGDGTARNVVATITQGGGANDTPGSIVITGTDIRGRALTETLALVAAGTATGLKAFATVTSIVQSGWVTNAAADTIVIGTGNKIGLPRRLALGTYQVVAAWLNQTAQAVTVTASSSDLSQNTIDGSAGTYDGSKRLRALLFGFTSDDLV